MILTVVVADQHHFIRGIISNKYIFQCRSGARNSISKLGIHQVIQKVMWSAGCYWRRK